MKRFLTLAVLGLVALGASSVAYANVCAVDAVPAASLLFPYVVYDYDGGFTGDTTLFSITNTSSDAQIVHITIWTDWSQPVLDYNVVLTGYDVYRQNIRDILRTDGGGGILPGPLTGDTQWMDQSDLNDELIGAGKVPVPLGPYSPSNELIQPPITMAALDAAEATWDGAAYVPLNSNEWDLNCNPDYQNGGWLGSPNNYTFPIDDVSLAFFKNLLLASQTADKGFWCGTPANDVTDDVLDAVGSVWWMDRDSGPAQFYITADVVGNCNKLFPNSPTFWVPYVEGPSTTGIVKYDNVLIGDLIYLNTNDFLSETYNAVHLEAIDPRAARLGSVETAIPNLAADQAATSDVTFYHRYTLQENATTGALEQLSSDGREPLPTAWAFRYQIDGANDVDTNVRIFKKASLTLPIDNIPTPDLVPGFPVGSSIPDELWASTCQPYTYYSWDEDENVAGAPGGGFQPPWSGTEPEPAPTPNLAPFETQEFGVSNLAVVESGTDLAYGWMLFVWPPSNGSTMDIFQTWMGVKYTGFDLFSAAKEGAVMGHYGCDATQVLPKLGWDLYPKFTP